MIKQAETPSLALSESLMASAHCVRAVLAGRSLSDSLEKTPARLRPAAQAISFHVMRQLGFAQAVRLKLVRRAPADARLHALLLVAITLLETALQAQPGGQVLSRSTPVYAVHTLVDQAVQATAQWFKSYKSLMNAVLRTYIRQRPKLLKSVLQHDEARYNYPLWWINEVRKAYPECWQELLVAGNQPGPLYLRVNQRKSTVKQVLELFQQATISARPLENQAIMVDPPLPVTTLPGFEQGLWSVQDISAQLAAALLPLDPGMRVLDACAAPGGKTAHILERESVSLLALDADSKRLKRVHDNLQRLGLYGGNVEVRCADAALLDEWWDGIPFQAILADVPCTASGVVRRHPDIRWLRQSFDIERTAALQRNIIDALWATLDTNGYLLFSTCSIFPQEGEEQAQAFMVRHTDALRREAPGQLLPLSDSSAKASGDGFFYALFQKNGAKR